MTNLSTRTPWRTVIAFGAPAVGAGYMFLLLSLYVMKFATDVLLIAPAVMGLIFSASRIWDAVSDPLAGYLSDRTTFRLGRRRTWILASMLPIGAAFIMVFSPPLHLSGGALTAWMALGVIGFYSAMTVFFVPHLSLGAELTDDYHERTRLFGMRHAFYTLGSILALVSMYLLINAELEGEAQVRLVAGTQAWIAAGVMACLLIFAVARLRERAEFQGRAAPSPLRALRDIAANEHARRLYTVWFIESFGGAAIGALTLYITQYVVGAVQWAPLIILCYMVPSSLAPPAWLALSRRIGKIRTWMIGMCGTAVSFGSMLGLLQVDSVEGRLAWIMCAAVTAGFSAGCGGSIGPSVQGDVIDYDELKTGERKEGAYYAAWMFINKSALGVVLLVTGFALQFAGFVPNAEQTAAVKLTMLGLYSGLPLLFFVTGASLLSRFRLDEKAHAQIRAALGRA
ncbi:MAG: MFS transporter [Pseudomonadales bacterium]|nr:MFS transporter [Pseudomonadales bacterium]MCP5184573.1 MFS transporter [Pseudomonadales bacterium]